MFSIKMTGLYIKGRPVKLVYKKPLASLSENLKK